MSTYDPKARGLPRLPVIAGSPTDIGDTGIVVRNPVTGEPLTEVPDVGDRGVDLAVAAATSAAESWADLPPRDRATSMLRFADALEDHADELSGLEALDVGKPLALAPAEIASAIDKVRFFAGSARVLHGIAAQEYRPPFTSFVRREPVGVVAALAPWNYPFALGVWKIAPALAAGNTVVLKPSPVTPLSTLRLAEIAAEVMPPGVLNVVTGGPSTGEALVRHPGVAMVSVTGGTATGKAVMRAASESVKRIHLELGGNAPVLVFDDADLDRLADAYFMAAFRNSGQDCHAASRVYAAPAIHDKVVETIAGVARSVVVGNGLDPATTMGPLVSADHRDRVAGLVERALGTGRVELVVGGAGDWERGYFYSPTVLRGTRHDDEIVQEEVFGPVVTVTPFSGEAEAVAMANGVAQGLAASVWTADLDRAMRVSRRLDVGTVWVNSHGATVAEMPFGGRKDSGFGADLSIHALEAHTNHKHVAIAVAPERGDDAI
ncbi:aldehyde dehydrogenase family protein [Phytoactinopolyspora alkaliphila]|uniref:Aldehyde dehydrogenase family protein n=1 Tax=Phytoactinopolyspora alkaliphila TaxID=1783498 RepID=A0A6N9YQV7_9ACTN|nr:aldehyde dehydrogenase family protein [Phytoactinopolyspora alkaliphila]NED97436.1 aldehyde dehydrogenase family protein [Phytoactinopolyspora alkaliphila]